MFPTLPKIFKSYGLPADVRTLLLLRKAMDKGLVKTLGDIYVILKSIVVKDPKKIGPYTRAYYDYFLSIEINPGERLDEAIERSSTFEKWLENFELNNKERQDMSMDDKINRFLDEVHITSYDIQKVLDGKKLFDEDDPRLKDEGGGAMEDAERRKLEKAADYLGIDLEELLERMEEIAKQQMDRHEGGSHWIGRFGISPYGNGGAAFGGIRVGGSGGGKMARAVVDDPRYYPVDMDARLRDDNVDAALAALKGVIEESAVEELDVNKTIKDGLERGGLFLPEMRDITNEKMQILLLIDNGGYSMDPHIHSVTKLFKKMKTRFAHDMETFYFHNTIYKQVYTDERRTKGITIDRLCDYDPNYMVFVVGDAAMAPYELNQQSYHDWMQIKEKFKKIAWLNPDSMRAWSYSETCAFLGKMFPMYTLTPKGIEDAVREMNKKRTMR